MRDVFNLASAELPAEHDREGRRFRAARVGDALGADLIGGGLYELPAGERTYPYHYHHGVEEWLLVIDGTPSVRTPEGSRELAPGDVVCFSPGAEGAHDVTGPGRVLILSTGTSPSIAVYPDSDKVGSRPDDPADRLNFRRGDAVDYWEGE
jgi:uncharacterized cupin superfamily protein